MSKLLDTLGEIFRAIIRYWLYIVWIIVIYIVILKYTHLHMPFILWYSMTHFGLSIYGLCLLMIFDDDFIDSEVER